MIIFWIFTFFVGSSAFAFAYIFLQLGLGLSIAYAVLAMLVCRGLLSMARRWLIFRDRLAPETDVLERTVETNRAIFWKRSLYVAAVPTVPARRELRPLPRAVLHLDEDWQGHDEPGRRQLWGED